MDISMVWTTGHAEPGPGWSLVSRHPAEDLPEMLTRKDGVVWVDIPHWDDEAYRVLSEVFCFHPLATARSTRPSTRPLPWSR
jgi:Mg2+ and Co2+ transporter CorA